MSHKFGVQGLSQTSTQPVVDSADVTALKAAQKRVRELDAELQDVTQQLAKIQSWADGTIQAKGWDARTNTSGNKPANPVQELHTRKVALECEFRQAGYRMLSLIDPDMFVAEKLLNDPNARLTDDQKQQSMTVVSKLIDDQRQKISELDSKIQTLSSDIRNGNDRIAPLEKQRDDLQLVLKAYELLRNDLFPPPPNY